jgi:hypothetical protein
MDGHTQETNTEKKNQCQAIQHEFEPVGPTLVVLLYITLPTYLSHMQRDMLHLQKFSYRMTFASMANFTFMHLYMGASIVKWTKKVLWDMEAMIFLVKRL